jgi:hypothetical protein
MQMHKNTTQQKQRNNTANIKLPDVSGSDLHKILGNMVFKSTVEFSVQFIVTPKQH